MLALALALTLGAQRPVSLPEALRLAAAQNPEAAAARAQAQVAEATIRRARSAWLPELTATGRGVVTKASAARRSSSAPVGSTWGEFAEVMMERP